MKQHSRDCIKFNGRYLVNNEASRGQHSEGLNHFMNGRIPRDGTFHNHQLIKLE